MKEQDYINISNLIRIRALMEIADKLLFCGELDDKEISDLKRRLNYLEHRLVQVSPKIEE